MKGPSGVHVHHACNPFFTALQHQVTAPAAKKANISCCQFLKIVYKNKLFLKNSPFIEYSIFLENSLFEKIGLFLKNSLF
jgi:hypothetical protein